MLTETGRGEAPDIRAGSNRGFWLVSGSLLAAGLLLVGAIWANRDLKDAIAHAQASLRAGHAAAEQTLKDTGSFATADASGMASSANALALLGPDDPSAGPDELSILASQTAWAAAVQARPGACFYMRMDVSGLVLYGTGSVCTGREAMTSSEPRW